MTANHRPLEEGDIELIDRVRHTPCLYDTKDPNFRLVYKKEQEWQSIADGLAMSHWEARKRWTVLRDRYARELKQLILHPDSMEYGKSDFFLRMDFIRNFVKKREVKRKHGNSRGAKNRNDEMPRPIKLYKVKHESNSCETDGHEVSQQEKQYILDYNGQDLSSGRYSYVENISQEPIQPVDQNEDVNNVEQEYQDYVDDTSVTYETVEEDQEAITQDDNESYMLSSPINNNGGITVKPESSHMVNSFNISAVEEDRTNPLPQLQQKPVITNVCTETTAPSLPVDTEEYFSKTIALYLRQLSPRYKIKAKVQIMQIIEKYIDLEESKS